MISLAPAASHSLNRNRTRLVYNIFRTIHNSATIQIELTRVAYDGYYRRRCVIINYNIIIIIIIVITTTIVDTLL